MVSRPPFHRLKSDPLATLVGDSTSKSLTSGNSKILLEGPYTSQDLKNGLVTFENKNIFPSGPITYAFAPDRFNPQQKVGDVIFHGEGTVARDDEDGPMIMFFHDVRVPAGTTKVQNPADLRSKSTSMINESTIAAARTEAQRLLGLPEMKAKIPPSVWTPASSPTP